MTPYHVWSGLAWMVGVATLGVGVLLGDERIAWCALFMSAAIATYNITASVNAVGRAQREAFEMGREYERRAESGVSHLR